MVLTRSGLEGFALTFGVGAEQHAHVHAHVHVAHELFQTTGSFTPLEAELDLAGSGTGGVLLWLGDVIGAGGDGGGHLTWLQMSSGAGHIW